MQKKNKRDTIPKIHFGEKLVTYQFRNVLKAVRGEETISEVVTAKDNLDTGVAFADIIYSVPHYHLKTIETYHLVSGKLRIWVGTETYVLKKPGQCVLIPKGAVHRAESLEAGKPARVLVTSIPAWTPEDYHYPTDE